MLEELDTLGACLLIAVMAGTFLYFVIAHQLGFSYAKKLFGIADKLAEKWSKYLTEEKTTVVKLCREMAQSFFDGNNVATD